MSNYVTISCLGPRPLAVPADVSDEEAISRMIAHWQAQLDRVLPDRPDLIVLPEACDRPDPLGFPLERRLSYYRARQDRIRDFFADVAKRHGCYIAYPAHVEAEDGMWLNAMQLIDRAGGVTGAYVKNHLTPDEHVKTNILYGGEAPIFECDFGRVASAICFDLNFEELLRRYAAAKPDLIIFPSMYHGGLMQGYWAYACRSYFAGAVAGAPCTIVTPLGEVAAGSTNYYSFITTRVNLDYVVLHIDENDAKFPAIKRKYGPSVVIHDPGYLGCVLLTSESKDVTADDIVAEFGLELMDDYFARADRSRRAPGRMAP
ncbi:hypothetical protein OMP38_15575 [Cohnella ginsengisoli]|uniref:CN hydrolase domain-containing protein n=1 Tax=Cohnella ginsengisoli TaxID=425004 RepID=A0A9X4QN52_9BACL|nr:nitrilase-related carbon-nitrogen hydrolase [Cohnella ginsengisoli]MDG0792126.1 hypothetical protein [Cohnella ginsengisoli]